jgi:hypothetical protein
LARTSVFPPWEGGKALRYASGDRSGEVSGAGACCGCVASGLRRRTAAVAGARRQPSTMSSGAPCGICPSLSMPWSWRCTLARSVRALQAEARAAPVAAAVCAGDMPPRRERLAAVRGDSDPARGGVRRAQLEDGEGDRQAFTLLGPQGCAALQAVVMDMNSAYELEVRLHAPQAQVVCASSTSWPSTPARHRSSTRG